jgi:hypothetical protein
MIHEIRIRYGGVALLSLLLLVMALACGEDSYVPDDPDVVAELYKLYPNASDVSWTKHGDYFVAECINGDDELDVWIGQSAQWVMTEAKITRSQLPASVNTAFVESDYADWEIESLTLQSYPSAPGELYVIEVKDKDKNDIVLLYFSDDGTLAHSREVTDGDNTHWPTLS